MARTIRLTVHAPDDPDGVFWSANEVIGPSGDWETWVAHFQVSDFNSKVKPCQQAAPISSSVPATVPVQTAPADSGFTAPQADSKRHHSDMVAAVAA